MNIKLLVVEDNVTDRHLIGEYLSQANNIHYDYVEKLSEALDKLNEHSYDALILDLGLPDSFGLDTFYKIHDEFPSMPTVIMSGLGEKEIAKKAVQDGAHDYIVKGQIDTNLLTRSIRYAIKRQEARNKTNSKVGTKHQEDFGGLIRDYERILSMLIANKLVKSPEILNEIQNLSQAIYDQGLHPRDLVHFAKAQGILPKNNDLLVLLNIDLASELCACLYKGIYAVEPERSLR